MAARIILACLAAFLFLQFFAWETDAVAIQRRDTASQNTTQTLEDALKSFQEGFQKLVTNIQGNELFQNVSQSLKSFGEQVQQQGHQLVEKIQSATKAPEQQ